MPSMTRNAIVVDLNRCIGCLACEVACKQEHEEIALGQHWCRVQTDGPVGEFPHLTQYWLPTLCQQCVNAPCIEVCPTGSSYRNEEDGVVLIDTSTCIGCKSCLQACPYGVRVFDEANSIVTKCTLCKELREAGDLPACVKACCGEARFFGDLDDPDSDASKILAEYPDEDKHQLKDSGNGPTTVYILSERYGKWASDDAVQISND